MRDKSRTFISFTADTASIEQIKLFTIYYKNAFI